MRPYHHDLKGCNSRLDELQAAFLRVKLKHIGSWTGHRSQIAAQYQSTLPKALIPFVPDWAHPSWHLYVIQCADRDLTQQELAEHGIQTLIHYPIAPYLPEAYHEMGCKQGKFPITERLCKEVLSLPIGPHLEPAQIDYICDKISDIACQLDA